MPNGGSDCCATCWFNRNNHGEAGYAHAGSAEPAYCEIRHLEIPDPSWTYCANHPRRSPARDRVPIGPVFIDPREEGREIWKESPDTEEVRTHLLDLLARIEEQPKERHHARFRLGLVGQFCPTSAALLQQDAAARPNFAAPIYGGPFGAMPAIPAELPPIFLAWAQDDDLALNAVVKFYDALKSAGIKPEAHIFSTGGHGFGMRKQGSSSDHWIDEFYYWLEARGFTRPVAR